MKIVLTLLVAVVVCITPLLADPSAERLDESNAVLKAIMDATDQGDVPQNPRTCLNEK